MLSPSDEAITPRFKLCALWLAVAPFYQSCNFVHMAMATHALLLDEEYQSWLFGRTGFFQCCIRDGQWAIFKTTPGAPAATLYHGCTLYEVWSILASNEWRAGLWGGAPLAVWGATTRSMGLDRSAADRGWNARKHGRKIPDCWDCPVVLGFAFNLAECGRHGITPLSTCSPRRGSRVKIPRAKTTSRGGSKNQ